MAYTTVEKDGEHWMLCHSVNDAHLDEKIAGMKGDDPSPTLNAGGKSAVCCSDGRAARAC